MLRAPAHGHEAAAVVPRVDASLSRAAVRHPVPDPAARRTLHGRRPADRPTTLTWPSSANGAVPDAVSRPTDARDSPAVRAANTSASSSLDQPDNQPSPSRTVGQDQVRIIEPAPGCTPGPAVHDQ